ncbi:MAG TPA: nucleotide exchange factor GrpE [Vicinamibacterales bacterium]|nr:nucleotide exchange factor GrpE [Vicinamibacterales bacterium]
MNEPELQESAPADRGSTEPASAAPSRSEADALAALRKEKDTLQDRLLRTAAEFDNYRKRVDRERRELSDFVAADMLTELLPILDNLERALQAPAGGDADAYRQGVEMIQRQMLDLLRKRGVKPIEAVGADFDPNYHQAVSHDISPDHREGEVIEELRRGYMLGERLLRPAMVKVAKAS